MRSLTTRLVVPGILAFFWVCPINDAAAADEGGSYKVTAVTNGGTIAGKVTWEGSRPTLAPMPLNKNPDVCDAGGKGTRPSNRLLIGTSGGVKNAVLSLEGVTQGKPLPSGPFTLDQKGCDYDPHILVVPTKADLKLKSSDNVLHNVHMFGAANYNIPFPNPVELEKKMRKPGVVRVQCDAGHGWMTAFIHVADHPYHAVTGDDGAFQLTDVPPGKYTIHMWHEHWKVTGTTEKDGKIATYAFADPIVQSQSVEVAAGGRAAVNFTMKAEP